MKFILLNLQLLFIHYFEIFNLLYFKSKFYFKYKYNTLVAHFLKNEILIISFSYSCHLNIFSLKIKYFILSFLFRFHKVLIFFHFQLNYSLLKIHFPLRKKLTYKSLIFFSSIELKFYKS